MRVRVKGTADFHYFSLYDETLGYDRIVEFLETHCAFVADKFLYQQEEDLYLCDNEIFIIWQKIIADQNALNLRISELKLEHGDLMVDDVINKAIFHNIQDEADAINYELDRAFGEV